MFELFRDAGGGWRWRFVHPKNHKVIADSAESYTKRYLAVKGAELVRSMVPGAGIVEVIDTRNPREAANAS
jgi:uncharacterized protein YegP (UPF0339 family)